MQDKGGGPRPPHQRETWALHEDVWTLHVERPPE